MKVYWQEKHLLKFRIKFNESYDLFGIEIQYDQGKWGWLETIYSYSDYNICDRFNYIQNDYVFESLTEVQQKVKKIMNEQEEIWDKAEAEYRKREKERHDRKNKYKGYEQEYTFPFLDPRNAVHGLSMSEPQEEKGMLSIFKSKKKRKKR